MSLNYGYSFRDVTRPKLRLYRPVKTPGPLILWPTPQILYVKMGKFWWGTVRWCLNSLWRLLDNRLMFSLTLNCVCMAILTFEFAFQLHRTYKLISHMKFWTGEEFEDALFKLHGPLKKWKRICFACIRRLGYPHYPQSGSHTIQDFSIFFRLANYVQIRISFRSYIESINSINIEYSICLWILSSWQD